jgi:hypothetical protein
MPETLFHLLKEAAERSSSWIPLGSERGVNQDLADFPGRRLSRLAPTPGRSLDVNTERRAQRLERLPKTSAPAARWARRNVTLARRALLGHIVFRVERGLGVNRMRWPLWRKAKWLSRQEFVVAPGVRRRVVRPRRNAASPRDAAVGLPTPMRAARDFLARKARRASWGPHPQNRASRRASG